MRGSRPRSDKGMESTMQPMFENMVRERYSSAMDFDVKVFFRSSIQPAVRYKPRNKDALQGFLRSRVVYLLL